MELSIYIIFYASVVTFISYTMTKEEIFQKWRDLFKNYPKWYYLVNCSYCFSFWVTLFVCKWDFTIIIIFIFANLIMSILDMGA